VADDFLTDEQQAERARQWVRENGMFIAAGVVLGLAVLFGWQSWQDRQLEVAGDAAVVWGQLSSAINGERYNEVDEAFAVLEKDFPGTPYVDQARLALAQMHMARNSPEQALEQLITLADSGNDEQLREVANLRRAQVLLFMEDYDAALAVLDQPRAESYKALQYDLRGDVLFARGELDAAADAYRTALAADTGSAIDRAYVQMKLDDVSGSLPLQAADDQAAEASTEPAAAE